MIYGTIVGASAAGITHILQHCQLWVIFVNYHLSSENTCTCSIHFSKSEKEFKNINQPKDCSLHRNSEYTVQMFDPP